MCITRTIGIYETSDKIDYENSDWSIAILIEKKWSKLNNGSR